MWNLGCTLLGLDLDEIKYQCCGDCQQLLDGAAEGQQQDAVVERVKRARNSWDYSLRRLGPIIDPTPRGNARPLQQAGPEAQRRAEAIAKAAVRAVLRRGRAAVAAEALAAADEHSGPAVYAEEGYELLPPGEEELAGLHAPAAAGTAAAAAAAAP